MDEENIQDHYKFLNAKKLKRELILWMLKTSIIIETFTTIVWSTMYMEQKI